MNTRNTEDTGLMWRNRTDILNKSKRKTPAWIDRYYFTSETHVKTKERLKRTKGGSERQNMAHEVRTTK